MTSRIMPIFLKWIVAHRHIDFAADVPSQTTFQVSKYSSIEIKIIDNEIEKVLAKGVIKEVDADEKQLVFPIFTSLKYVVNLERF